MKINFTFYLLWRLFKGTAVVLTSPIWFPILIVLYNVGIIVEDIWDWYKKVRRDWAEGQK